MNYSGMYSSAPEYDPAASKQMNAYNDAQAAKKKQQEQDAQTMTDEHANTPGNVAVGANSFSVHQAGTDPPPGSAGSGSSTSSGSSQPASAPGTSGSPGASAGSSSPAIPPAPVFQLPNAQTPGRANGMGKSAAFAGNLQTTLPPSQSAPGSGQSYESGSGSSGQQSYSDPNGAGNMTATGTPQTLSSSMPSVMTPQEQAYYAQNGTLTGIDESHAGQVLDARTGDWRQAAPVTYGWDENGNRVPLQNGQPIGQGGGMQGAPSDEMVAIQKGEQDATAEHDKALGGMIQGTYADEALAGRRMAEMNATNGGGMGGAFAGGAAQVAIGGEQSRLKARNDFNKQTLELKMAYLDRMMKQAEHEDNVDLQKWLQTESDKTAMMLKQTDVGMATADRQAQADALKAQVDAQS